MGCWTLTGEKRMVTVLGDESPFNLSPGNRRH